MQWKDKEKPHAHICEPEEDQIVIIDWVCAALRPMRAHRPHWSAPQIPIHYNMFFDIWDIFSFCFIFLRIPCYTPNEEDEERACVHFALMPPMRRRRRKIKKRKLKQKCLAAEWPLLREKIILQQLRIKMHGNRKMIFLLLSCVARAERATRNKKKNKSISYYFCEWKTYVRRLSIDTESQLVLSHKHDRYISFMRPDFLWIRASIYCSELWNVFLECFLTEFNVLSIYLIF